MSVIKISILLLALIIPGSRTQTVMRICEVDVSHLAPPQTISCPSGQVIRIQEAFWGRANPAIVDNTDGSNADRYCPDGVSGNDQDLCPGDPDDTLSKIRDICEDEESCQIRATASTFGQICPDVYKYLEFTYTCANLECTCAVNGTTLALDVFDDPDLMVYSTGQKTILSSYKMSEHDPCKFKFQAVTSGNTAPAPLSALTFNIGQHPRNPNKFYRSYKMFGPTVFERGVSKKKEKRVTLPYCWSSSNDDTDICIERVGDVLQYRSTKCPYALDVDVSRTPLSGTLYLERSANWTLFGMCGDCDDQWNGYVQADGTDVSDVPDEQARYLLITKSYHDSRSRRHVNIPW